MSDSFGSWVDIRTKFTQCFSPGESMSWKCQYWVILPHVAVDVCVPLLIVIMSPYKFSVSLARFPLLVWPKTSSIPDVNIGLGG